MAVDRCNKPHVAWYQYDGPDVEEGERRIYYARQICDAAPVILSRGRKRYCFPMQTDIVDVFCWKHMDGAVGYKVYANKELTELLGIFSASDNFVFCKHCVKPGSTNTYYLVSFNEVGVASFPTEVTIS